MVVLMDVTAQGKDDAGRICNGSECEEEVSTRIDPSLLEKIPSSIPTSCIYRYKDFIATLLTDGFYGNIYKVQHRETKEVMVLKMNKPDVERDTCTMMDEIKMMSHLSHENVIRFLGICVDDSRVHLLCEYINGGDLESLLLEHSVYLDWTTRLYLARDIAEGMRYLHKNGVIHRDLTSKNCLIKEINGWRYAIVADLGLATEIKEQSIVGSPYNMAPELLRGENYDEKADVFSYGIILCEIIGRVPADPDELPRTNSFGLDVEKFQHMTGDCPHDFLQTALCCCQMEPSSRPTFVETAKHLECVHVETKPFRPTISEAMDSSPPETPSSTEQRICQPDNRLELEGTGRGREGEEDITKTPELVPPAIIVSNDTSPVMVRSAEKRRQSWIPSRYKLFHTSTDDLLRNTPSKLKSFFHRVLRVQTHFDPSKQKKIKNGAKQRSASLLKSYSMINPQENGGVVTFVEKECSEDSYPNPPHVREYLRGKSSERHVPSESGSREDSVDGNISPRSLGSKSTLSFTSPSSLDRATSPNSFEITRSSPSSRNASLPDTPVSRLLDDSNRPRRKSTPVCNVLGTGPLPRRTASHRECEMYNADHSTPEVHADETGRIKNRKSPFWFLKRRGSKCKDPE